MSSLRQARRAPAPGGDVEAAKGGEERDDPSVGGGGPSSVRSPVLLAKIVLRKVAALLLSNELDVTRPGGVITLLKDVVLGILWGVMLIATLMFLDHRGFVHLEGARNFRNSAFRVLNDPDTIAHLEEFYELRVVDAREYAAKRREIDNVARDFQKHQDALERKTREGKEQDEEFNATKKEREELMAHPLLRLDRYCGECTWSGGTFCYQRAEYLMEKYNLSKVAARVSAMEKTGCWKEEKGGVTCDSCIDTKN